MGSDIEMFFFPSKAQNHGFNFLWDDVNKLT